MLVSSLVIPCPWI